ncbi:hypothetical protein CDD83_6590 [Cordyceps sp. RAO-2017]|nr:hypothetical protein CDD83_6590 [Cordyceps sp. RAO-2017]
MIVFNSVQSQRTDVDYFFHPRQRKSLLQIVQNLKQASFFGGSFFSSDEISNAVETAETFLREKKVPISEEDEILLQEAIKLGHVAVGNKLRRLSNKYHEIPVCVESFPGNASHAWSLDGRAGDNVCTSASLLSAAQKLIHDAVDAPEQLNSLLNGGLIHEGVQQRRHVLADQASGAMASGNGKKSETKAGNTRLGDDSPRKPRTRGRGVVEPKEKKAGELEKMIVFYENENVAWYLASMLDVLQIRHLIYAKGLTAERRARYVGTFQHSPTFRVLLMDLSQAAFGLDMHEASRVYFINPVLNPQVEAQAIGRVRRISQKKPVSVETLVLRNSLDEVILERKRHMSPTEHRQAKSILDVRPIYNWIKNARVESLPDD